MRTIRTKAGVLELTDATIDDLRAISRYWPMKLVGISNEPFFGLVFQRGDREMHGVKLQPADNSESNARAWLQLNAASIASALPNYLARGHRGVMVPCAYYKEKGNGTVEAGIAFFVGPDPESGSRDESDSMWDHRLGVGATSMIMDMVAALAEASRESGQPFWTVIGMDLRPRLALGGLAMHFVVEGPRVFVVKDPLHEDDPVWEALIRAGLPTLPYAPMRPFPLNEVDEAKPESLPTPLPDSAVVKEPVRAREALRNQGRPVFRVRNDRALGDSLLGLMGGMLVGILAADLTHWIGLAIVLPVGGLAVGWKHGVAKRYDVCSDPACGHILEPRDATCPACGGTIAGSIRHRDERLEAEEAYERLHAKERRRSRHG